MAGFCKNRRDDLYIHMKSVAELPLNVELFSSLLIQP